MMTPPGWLHTVALVSLAASALSALVVVAHVVAHPQKMGIMNVVWPLTAVWAGPLGAWAYFAVGRMGTAEAAKAAEARGEEPPGKRKPFWQKVALGSTHCGSGCTLGDVVAEGLVLLWPITILGSHVYGTWLVDFVAAFLLGIVFQYFTIAPMRGLGLRDGVVAAVKADTASLVSWQVGMYGWMAIALFALFSPESLPKSGPVFWFMMQVAMFAGFLTSYPVNWWLLRSGIKEAM